MGADKWGATLLIKKRRGREREGEREEHNIDREREGKR